MRATKFNSPRDGQPQPPHPGSQSGAHASPEAETDRTPPPERWRPGADDETDRPARRVPIQAWLVQEMTAGASIYMSEVADYEVCRELTQLIRAGLNFLTAFQKKTMVVMCNKRTDFIP